MRRPNPAHSLQAIFVLDSSSDTRIPTTRPPLYPDVSGNYFVTSQVNASVSIIGATESQESLIFGTSFTRVPTIWRSELSQEYQELGEALGKMTEFEEADDWGIERPVYEAASNVAAQLMASDCPAPRLLTHGPKSVVFNWSQENDNLYLTISADTLSAFVSTPKEIKQRIDYPTIALLNPALLLGTLESASLPQPAPLITVSSSTSIKLVA